MTERAHALHQSEAALGSPDRMGRLLLESGKISLDNLQQIIRFQEKHGLRFGEAAVALNLVTTDDIRQVLATQFSYPALPGKQSRLDRRLLAAYQPQSALAEALRGLRSELILRYFNHGEHLTLPLLGTGDGPGIARTTANLAVVFAQMGMRTLLVDSNMRQPQICGLFGIQNRPGLSDLLAGRTPFAPQQVAELPSLSLLHAGTLAPNPQELLSGPVYREKMAAIACHFDVILISTAPLEPHMDAQIVAAQAGSALLLVQQNETRIKSVERACQRLHSVNVQLLGMAVTL